MTQVVAVVISSVRMRLYFIVFALSWFSFFFSSRRRHTRCALVTGVQTCALPISLFLDEVGDIPLALQVKLLRFLQERVIERIGGRQQIPVDTRIVCATHQDVDAMVADGRFREDLYYRLAEIVVRIPALAERPGDAGLLAKHFEIGRAHV